MSKGFKKELVFIMEAFGAWGSWEGCSFDNFAAVLYERQTSISFLPR